jgi:hypothetical protein
MLSNEKIKKKRVNSLKLNHLKDHITITCVPGEISTVLQQVRVVTASYCILQIEIISLKVNFKIVNNFLHKYVSI